MLISSGGYVVTVVCHSNAIKILRSYSFWVFQSLNSGMDLKQIFSICLPQEDLKLIRCVCVGRGGGGGLSGNNCRHGNVLILFGLDFLVLKRALLNSYYYSYIFTPQFLRGVGVLCSPMIFRWVGERAGGRQEKVFWAVSQKPLGVGS